MSTAALPRPAERVAIVSLLLVFLCGGALGALVMNYWGHSPAHGFTGKDGMSISVTDSVDEWKKQLDLTEEQTRKLTSILDDFSHYYDNLLADGNSRVLQILNEEQRQRYEQMLERHKK